MSLIMTVFIDHVPLNCLNINALESDNFSELLLTYLLSSEKIHLTNFLKTEHQFNDFKILHLLIKLSLKNEPYISNYWHFINILNSDVLKLYLKPRI
ncbi:hypothetical protein HZS_6639 [Henneguya salminicola]|nr:hypothetical protein HZS_6639 [Henneguya salminicola]